MAAASTYDLLVQLRDAATSCLKSNGVPFCSYVWAGGEPPISCDKDIAVSVTGDYASTVDGCDYLEWVDIKVYVDVCGGDPTSAKEADTISCAFYKKLDMVRSGIHDWFVKNQLTCTAVDPKRFSNFRFAGTSENGCVRYVSDWRIRL